MRSEYAVASCQKPAETMCMINKKYGVVYTPDTLANFVAGLPMIMISFSDYMSAF